MAKGLSRERILEAALELTDAAGIEGLTMRALGRACGVEAMSLYRYVTNKDDLLDGIQAAVVAEMQPVDMDLPWPEALEALAREFRRVLARHPRAIPLFVRPMASTGAFEAAERAFDVLEAAGFDGGDALRAFQALLAFVVGQALWQYTPEGTRAVDDEFEFGLEVLLLGLQRKLEQG